MVTQQGTIFKKSSYDQASSLSKLFFYWLLSFYLEFQKKRIKTNDLEQCPKYDQSERIGEKLEKQWNEELKKLKTGGQPSLGWTIIRTIGWHYSFTFILLFSSSMAHLAQTVCMGYLIEALYQYNMEKDHSDEIRWKIYLTAACVVGAQFFNTYVANMYWFLARKCGIDIRVACSRLIYQKSLRLSQASLGETTVGQIVNLLSSDVSRFDLASEFPFFLIQGPLEVIICIIILWPMLNISTIIGLLVLFLYIPFQTLMGKAFGALREKGAFLTDDRIRLMNEFIPAMRVIKMYAWEKPLTLLVDLARKREVSKIRWAAYLRGLNLGLGTIAEKLIMFLTLVSFVMRGNQLSARTVFVAMSLIRQLQSSITIFIPLGISTGAESLIAIKRIRDFLLLPEYESSGNLSRGLGGAGIKKSKVSYSDVTLSWRDDKEPLLKNLTFDASPGKLIAIVGPVGSGKSSILMSILGEITAKAGKAEVLGSVSYACQQSWIFAGTVRDNILFGNEFEASRYKRVIFVSALERDLQILPSGDQTIVGDRGASLSGGQKARINLARALYARADIYLLDDPLSAVDAPVAKHIFENSIKDFLSNKIAILVTHQLQFMKSADSILLIRNGEQVCFGDYMELLNKGSDFIKYSQVLEVEHKVSETPDKTPKIIGLSSSRSSLRSRTSSLINPDVCGSTASVCTETADELPKVDNLPIGGDEDGPGVHELAGIKVSKHLLWTYICAGISVILFPFWVLYILGAELLISFVEYYFSLWADSAERKGRFLAEQTAQPNATFEVTNFVDDLSQNDNIIFLACITVVLFCWCCTRNFAFFAVCMRASIKLHNRLFHAIVRAPISFFDNNPPGIVLNRVSRDMGMVDDFLPSTFFDTVIILSNNFASLILMAFISPYLIAPAVILLLCCFYFRSRYVNIARDVKRLEGVTKTPVFNHLSSSLYGLTTIRAFRVQERFKETFDLYQDEHTSAYFTWIASSRFFITLINTMSFIFTGLVVLTCLLAIDSLNGSSVGLVITSAIGLSFGIQWGMRQWTEVETMMTSVERIEELRFIPPEAELEAPLSRKPPADWPKQGRITFLNVNLRYDSEKPPVLKDLNFKIEAKDKVGIVGRTGAGKSSIMTALFRMFEPEGHIIIDGIDINTIGLHDLRRKISIIPQEPIIFTGTLRYNLDPFNVKNDAEIWEALDQAQLKKAANSMGGLDSVLTDGGTNLSVGQRQLVCLARAILANNKILVLDEATANIDPTTDELIQQTIRKRFADCTVLTIAHRIQTIIDSDKILVMDAGKVVQFGDPASLVEDTEGIFYSMVQATGKDSADNLIKTAKRIKLNKNEGIEHKSDV
ncbi:multidrug resistance-associated protein 4 isoform X3 [Tetranychus urticae]|uniref:Uncharacterized protein n=1 Tax=Tetranychus urticae TaxID=32264 RepID=T1K7A9_TETUR|nr:multidrug resistance-associated protein 4 isoform X2 [Tetranychus urticae]XP_025016411.1 multidrug resistance-associated protein 4 isoform X3 [Tetranychus urticae]